MIKLEMKNYSMFLIEKLQRYLPSNQKQITEQTKFTYFPLGKTFEKQTKEIEDQEKN